jgi:cysteinyl-tRNA synthetase
MYVCGPTVYNDIHIGNARPFIFFDVVRRYLMYKGYDVFYVQNFTDVDDKLIRRSEETGLSVPEVADRYIQSFCEDMEALEISRADRHPRVTEHIDAIISFIQGLADKQIAYEIDGNVYYRISCFKSYGKLSHQQIEELLAGARIDVEEKKENPLDFALWKKAKGNEIAWDSPWGRGRPGWHIECSAMARLLLGDTLDIHAGGQDLIFPHHENEIAQSEALTGQPLARYWMHNGYVHINEEKMSKSLGNVVCVKTVLQKHRPQVLRFFMLSTHYRNPIQYSDALLEQAESGLTRIETTVHNLNHRLSVDGQATNLADKQLLGEIGDLLKRYEERMDDDFHTADAITSVFECVKVANQYLQNETVDGEVLRAFVSALATMGRVLGFDWSPGTGQLLDAEIEALIEQRNEARKCKNWALADKIRDQLKARGVTLEDTPQGVRWKR